jgi:ankyrin repeat protein
MNRIDEELIEAASENNVPEVRRLLGAGADVNATHKCGRTPLHWACSKGHGQVFKELLEYGADIEAKDNISFTPLHLACLNEHVAIVIELLSPTDSNHGATTTSILGKRKSRGANIEAKDNEDYTPLHYASIHDGVAIVRALLSGGANILAANNQGELPIHNAMRFGRSEVAKCLLQHFYATTRPERPHLDWRSQQ